MKITNTRVYLNNEPSSNRLANVDLTLDDCFAVKGVRVMTGENGKFVTMPSRKVAGEYKNVCFPVTKEFHQELSDGVLAAYEEKLHPEHKNKQEEKQDEQGEGQESGQQQAQSGKGRRRHSAKPAHEQNAEIPIDAPESEQESEQAEEPDESEGESVGMGMGM